MTAKSVLSLGLFCCISNFILGQTFTNATLAMGIDEYLPPTMMGTGVSIHDIDNDGWEDIIFSVTEEGIICYSYHAGSYDRSVLYSGIGHFKTCLWGDYDNDNDDDLFITRDYRSVILLRNDGALNFTDVTEEAGFILTNEARSWGASWTDLDLDGYLDLYVANYNRAGVDPYSVNDWFYHNNGDGTFSEVSYDWGFIETVEATFQSTVFPFNSDIYPDLVAINDYNPRNKVFLSQGMGVYQNNNGVMQEEPHLDAMCAAVKDFDNDGDFDMFITNTSIWGNNLFVNDNGVMTNQGDEYNLAAYKFCAGSSWIDVNNDLSPDLYVADAEYWDTYNAPTTFDRDALYMNNNGVFTSSEYIEATGNSFNTYVVAKGDLNNDGFDDLVISTSLDDGIQVLINNAEAVQNGWIKVKLQGTVSNTNGYGSLIEYFVDGNRYIEFTNGGSDYLSQNSENMVLPIGVNDSVDSLFVHWPSQIVDTFYNLPRNQNYEFIEGSSFVQLASSSNLTSLCDGQEVILSIDEVSGVVQWNTGDAGFTINVTQFGSYWATIESEQGYIIYTDTISFEQSSSESITAMIQNPSCYGFGDGIIDLGLELGIDVQQANWSDGFNGTYRTNVAAGEYFVELTNMDGCVYSHSFNLSNPEYFGTFSNTTDVLCFEASSGVIFIESAFGGTSPYDVYLNTDVVASDLDFTELNTYAISGLPTGNYELEVLDNNGCSSESTLEITSPEELIATSAIDANQVEILVNGGTPPFLYEWSIEGIFGSSATLDPGFYSIVIVDANGCQTSVEVTIPVGVSEVSQTPLDFRLTNGQVVFNETQSRIFIYDLSGKLIHQTGKCNTIDVSGFSSGTYMLGAVDNFQSMRFAKFVIQN